MNQTTTTWFRELFISSPFPLNTANNTRALSASTLDALKEFYADRDARLKQFEDLKNIAEENTSSNIPLTMDAFAEDWNESQFWVSYFLSWEKMDVFLTRSSILMRRLRRWLRRC
jgi:hypothetical protein